MTSETSIATRLAYLLEHTEIPTQYLSRDHFDSLREHLDVEINDGEVNNGEIDDGEIDDGELRQLLRNSGIEILEPLPLPTSPKIDNYDDLRSALDELLEPTFVHLITGTQGVLWLVDSVSLYSLALHQRLKVDAELLETRKVECTLDQPRNTHLINTIFDNLVAVSSDPKALRALLLYDTVQYASKVQSNLVDAIELTGVAVDEAHQIAFAIEVKNNWKPAWGTSQPRAISFSQMGSSATKGRAKVIGNSWNQNFESISTADSTGSTNSADSADSMDAYSVLSLPSRRQPSFPIPFELISPHKEGSNNAAFVDTTKKKSLMSTFTQFIRTNIANKRSPESGRASG